MRWEVTTLGQVVQLERNRNEDLKRIYLGLENIQSDTGQIVGVTQCADDVSSAYAFEQDDVLYGRLRPYLNKVHLAKAPGCCSTEIFPLRTKAGLHPSWLSKFLRRSPIVKELNDSCTGARMPRTSPQAILGLRIPIPPIDEQERIVEVLDEAFAAIDKAKANIERNLTNARELFQSRLNDIFSNPSEDWEVKPLGEVCAVEMGQSPPSSTYNTEGNGEPLINGPVEFGPKPFSDTVMTKWTTAPKKFCVRGDVVLCVRGSTTGRMNIAGFDAAIGRGCAAIRYERNPMWLAFFIRFMGEQILNSGTGSTFPNFSSAQLCALSFPIPSDDQMNEMVEELKMMDESVARILIHYQTELGNLEELRQSILEQAFEGKLTEPVAA